MIAKNIILKNFKLHHDLSFDVKKQNLLIYGENGSGKSSIYEALYVNIYALKMTGEKVDVQEKYHHRDYLTEALEVNITFDNDQQLTRKDNNLENGSLLENQTLYCANERLLHELTEGDFYSIINTILVEHFPALSNLSTVYNGLSRQIKRYNKSKKETADKESIVASRSIADKAFKEKFSELMPITKINSILTENFTESFQIEFAIANASIDFSGIDLHFIAPKITLKVKGINDRGDFQSHFNEAKIKLISIAIYFALAKANETEGKLKMLALDDFLTSLDMANRKLIIQYILDDFKDYQKIIFTHNIQFYNIILKLINMRGENNQWDVKNIFLREENNKETAMIYSLHPSYLTQAEKKLKNGELESTGNFLRKEFERIMAEFEQILALGGKEKLNNVIAVLKKDDQYFYENPHEKLQKISERVESILSNEKQPDSAKLQQIKRCIAKLDKNKVSFKSTDYNILGKTEFYKNILMNPSSHANTEIEIYRKECNTTIKLLKELNKILEHLKPSELKKK